MTSDSERIHQDYLEAHHGQLMILASHAERLLETNAPRITVEASPDHPEGRIVTGAWTTDDGAMFLEEHAETPTEEQAAAEACHQNELLLAIARDRFARLQAMATALHTVDLSSQDSSHWRPGPLPYARAEHHIIRPAQALTVDVIRLHDISPWSTATAYHMEYDEGPITHALTMAVFDGRVVDVDSNIKPYQDEEFEQWHEVFGSQRMLELYDVLAGVFSSEEGLDAVLATLRQSFVGSPQETAILPLLAQMRVRAMAGKEALALQNLHGPTTLLPDVGVLNEWTDRLTAV